MRESASNRHNHNGWPKTTMVAKVDRHGKLIALASNEPIHVVLISDEPGNPFGVEIIHGPTSMISADVLKVAQNICKVGKSIVFHDAPITWRYNDVRKWWEAWHNDRAILHVESPKGNLPNDQTRALAKNKANDEIVK